MSKLQLTFLPIMFSTKKHGLFTALWVAFLDKFWPVQNEVRAMSLTLLQAGRDSFRIVYDRQNGIMSFISVEDAEIEGVHVQSLLLMISEMAIELVKQGKGPLRLNTREEMFLRESVKKWSMKVNPELLDISVTG